MSNIDLIKFGIIFALSYFAVIIGLYFSKLHKPRNSEELIKVILKNSYNNSCPLNYKRHSFTIYECHIQRYSIIFTGCKNHCIVDIGIERISVCEIFCTR